MAALRALAFPPLLIVYLHILICFINLKFVCLRRACDTIIFLKACLTFQGKQLPEQINEVFSQRKRQGNVFHMPVLIQLVYILVIVKATV